MKDSVRVAIAQINSTVGDLQGNAQKIVEYAAQAVGLGADFVIFPELALTGYPPEDLLLKRKFVTDTANTLRSLASKISSICAVIGFVERQGKDLYNAAAVLHEGELKAVAHKIFLPNYGPFDEKRYFTAGKKPLLLQYGHCLFGLNICEDIWHFVGPTKEQADAGAQFIININASPYYAGKVRVRHNILKTQAKANNIPIVYANLVGGQDELLFDGQSMVVDRRGTLKALLSPFKEELQAVDIPITAMNKSKKAGQTVVITGSISDRHKKPLPVRKVKLLDPVEEVYRALLLGLKDYVHKNEFQKVIIGLSGGVDSALVATLAVDALGKDNVVGVFMPSQYTSKASEIDAKELARLLGIKLMTVPITQIFKMYLSVLEPHFTGAGRNIAEENLQSRIRGTILMAFSNKFGWLVLSTGNKSEMSTGYATLYGDMVGGFAVLKDVPKTFVYKVVKFRNRLGKVIPDSIIKKAPTAELKPNQKDTDTLPEYGTLDPILKAYVEQDKHFSQIVRRGFNPEVVANVIGMVDRNEYKRRQSPPGIKITPKSFGKDRRMPITNKYREKGNE